MNFFWFLRVFLIIILFSEYNMNSSIPSPIIEGYINPFNSENLTEGFITSTPIESRTFCILIR